MKIKPEAILAALRSVPKRFCRGQQKSFWSVAPTLGIYKLLLGVIASLLLSGAFAVAQESKPLTLADSMDLAVRNSFLLHSSKEGVRGAEAMQREAFTGFLPKFSTSYNYTRLNEAPSFTFPGVAFNLPAPLGTGNIPANTFQTGTKDNYSWALEVRQPLYAGGGIAAGYEASRTAVEIARAEEKLTLLDLVREVKIFYFSILKAQRGVDVARQSVKRLTAHRDVARAFYDEGMIPRNDLLRAEVEMTNGNQRLLQAENSLEMAKAQFNTLIGRAVNSPVVIEDILQETVFEKSLDICMDEALRNRVEVKIYELRLAQAKSLVKQAESQYYPNLFLVGSYARYGDTPGVSGSPYRDQESWYVMAQASWNIWEWGKTRYSVAAGKSRETQAADMLAHLRQQIAIEVKNSYLSLQEAQKQIPVAKKAIEQAEENFRVSSERYHEQVGTATDVIDAQTILTTALSNYYNYLGDLGIAGARLERAMGTGSREK
jgi:outer membrane protein TolC